MERSPVLWSSCPPGKPSLSGCWRPSAPPMPSTASPPLDTPVIESAEILLAKGGGETEKQIYRFTKGG